MLRKVDSLGFFLLLAFSVFLVTAVEEGGTEYTWHSQVVLSLLILSIVTFFTFLLWERYQSVRSGETTQESVFPWRVATDRFAMGTLLHSFFTGASFLAVVINMPARFQVVNSSSPFDAGYRLLTLTICTPLGSTIAVIFTQKLKLAPLYILLVAPIVQVIGLGLMTTIPAQAGSFPSTIYGYEVILGLGFGLSMGTVILISPLVFEKRDSGMYSIFHSYQGIHRLTRDFCCSCRYGCHWPIPRYGW